MISHIMSRIDHLSVDTTARCGPDAAADIGGSKLEAEEATAQQAMA
jgi:hypothetical protein